MKVTVATLPVRGLEAFVWQQTTTGDLLQSIAPGPLEHALDFNNEVSAYKTKDLFHFNIATFFTERPDTIYSYDANKNQLIPIFVTDFKNKKLPIHCNEEISGYYLGSVAEPKQLTANTSTVQNHGFYIVDKKTLKGSFFNLVNDYLGGSTVEYPIYNLKGDYFIRNVDPGDLLDELDEALNSNQDLSSGLRNKLTKLRDSITDNDNNYILYARLKK
ncbi:MAG: hypothetical protein LIO93_07315 [Bacteroidales bacterium]|nr:hypothetical protein [Bacteroidales bacterium]